MSLVPYDDDLFSFPSDFFNPQKMFKNSIKIDLCEDDKCFRMVADCPAGTKKSAIKLEFDKGYLTLNASVKSDSCNDKSCNDKSFNDKSCNYILKERFSGQYSRRIFIADNLDRNGIKATYEDCVLRVTIPKLAEGKVSKSINIE